MPAPLVPELPAHPPVLPVPASLPRVPTLSRARAVPHARSRSPTRPTQEAQASGLRLGLEKKSGSRARELGVRKKLALPAGLLPTSPHNNPEPFGTPAWSSQPAWLRGGLWRHCPQPPSCLRPPAPSHPAGGTQPLVSASRCTCGASAWVAVPGRPSPRCLLTPPKFACGSTRHSA